MRSETATVVAHPTIRPRGTASMARGAMRVLHRDPKTGEIKIRVENADDLWHLHNLVQEGDLVRASTYRREDVKTDKVRPERGEKVRVTLTIRVEGVEFQAFSDRLRITGVIVEGPQKPLVSFLSLDDEEALLAHLRQYGVRELATIRAPAHGKMFPSGDASSVFFQEIHAKLRAADLGEALVVVGPGFTRDAFVEYVKARDPPLRSEERRVGKE